MSRHTFPDNWPAPDAYLLELGRMTSLWGSLESTVNLAISLLAGYAVPFDYRSVILIAHSNFQQRVDMVSALCEELKPDFPHLASYKTVIKKVELAQKARNKYAHNAVFTDEESGKVMVSYASARGKLKYSTEPVHLNDIKETIAKIHEATCAVHSLVTNTHLTPIWERENKTGPVG